MDGSLVRAPAEIDTEEHTVTLQGDEPVTFTFDRPQPDRLVLTSDTTTIELDLVDIDELPLRSRGFHWVQDYPYIG